MLSIEEIKNVSFRKAGIGGYKPEDVDAFIDQVLITMEQLRKEKSDLIKKMDILATRVEEYRADEDSVRNAMLSAQRVADSTIKDARAKAARIIEESENLAKAKLYDLNVQIKQQKKQYTMLLAECNRLRDDIVTHCNKHISIAKELPTPERIQALEASLDERYPTDNSEDYERAGEVVTAQVDPSAKSAETKSQETLIAKKAEDAPQNAKPVTAKPDAEAVLDNASDDSFDIHIVSDIEERETASTATQGKRDKQKGKSFASLKFGDDYDVDSDNDDNGNADSE